MKRKALLIGDSGIKDGYLSGVEYDLNNYAHFLKSLRGGAWLDNEISIIGNGSKYTILKEINVIKNRYDVLFIVFTGHGVYDESKKCRLLCVDNDEIAEKELWNLAPKQILILDSCSSLPNISQENFLQESSIIASYSIMSLARQRYENICEKCPSQQIYLYASKIGTFASDTENGGLYSINLLETLKTDKIQGKYLDIINAHKNTSIKIKLIAEQETDKFVDIYKKPYLPGAIYI